MRDHHTEGKHFSSVLREQTWGSTARAFWTCVPEIAHNRQLAHGHWGKIQRRGTRNISPPPPWQAPGEMISWFLVPWIGEYHSFNIMTKTASFARGSSRKCSTSEAAGSHLPRAQQMGQWPRVGTAREMPASIFPPMPLPLLCTRLLAQKCSLGTQASEGLSLHQLRGRLSMHIASSSQLRPVPLRNPPFGKVTFAQCRNIGQS